MTEAEEILTPEPGFVVKTYKTAAQAYEPSGKVFVNICSSATVERPCGATFQAVDDDHLDNKGLSNLRLPLLVGPARHLQDSSGHPAMAVDVIYHPCVVERALHGSHQHPPEHFKDYTVDLALKNVAEEYNLKIERANYQILEKAKYKGPPGETTGRTHSFPITKRPSEKPETPKDEPWKPKIEIIGEMTKKSAKPIMKKGFFDKPNTFGAAAAETLYPNGSAEGIQMDASSLQQTMDQYAKTGNLNTGKGVYRKGTTKDDFKAEPGLGHPSNMKELDKVGKSVESEKKPSESLFKFVGQTEEPAYRLQETASGGRLAYSIIIELPKVQTMRQVSLDVADTELQVRGGGYLLKVTLPQAVDTTAVKAKFKAKRKELEVIVPVKDDLD
ncbi:hypothetical protein CYMTET_50863 [Cymbomonas tetramitiformis]|uniref:PIH1 domain-containing protein 1 n=1 Tax=Cymbomonas tetramitiformis TaxID=36881 RepID=A0AAE0BMF1_9CHLO|nr:hypothetical protein CYMTET_50863 [Cymbomonas tetramitiformis]